MSIRNILVPLDGSECGGRALDTAVAVATSLSAHLDVLHVRPDAREAVPLLGEGMSGAMIEEMIDIAEREAGEREAKARAQFDAALSAANLDSVDGPPGPGRASAAWLAETGREDETVAWRGRLSDLIVTPAPAADTDASTALTLNAALFESGRPVLLAPSQPVAEVGRKVAVAWNGSPEGARAVAAAMPFLEGAETVRILTVTSEKTQAAVGSELERYLGWHNISTELIDVGETPGLVGQALFDKAGDADMLVMGAYTHSRLRQLILGGVTRYVMENATTPVLMSH